jgi:hypothetical protein
MKGKNEVQETAAQRQQAEIHLQRWNDFKMRVRPQIKMFAAETERMMAPDSRERKEATAMATADTSVKFAGAREKALAAETQAGGLGSSRQKLGVVGMGDDLATSSGTAAVAADRAVDQAYVQRTSAVAGMGRGEKSQAIDGFGQLASISAMQAENDAQASLEDRAGNAGLIAKTVGLGIGTWMNSPTTPGSQPDPRAGARGARGY